MVLKNMIYEGTKPSGKDKDIPLFTFSIGKPELRVLIEAINYTKKHTPELLETQQFRARLRTLLKQLSVAWRIAKNAKETNHWEV